MAGQTIALLASTAISGAGTTTSGTFTILSAAGYAVQATASATLLGTIKVQGSTDNVSYSDITGLTATLDGATTNVVLLEDACVGYAYVQAVFTYTSGSGNLAITASVQHED